MKGLILAAGRGKRMQELTYNQPKCTLKIDKTPLLQLQINALNKAGVNDIAVVTGYKRNFIEAYDVVEFHNKNWADTDMISSLFCADKWLEDSSAIISYSDIFYSDTIASDLASSSASIAIAYDVNWLSLWQKRFKNVLEDAETFRLNDANMVIEIGLKPYSINEIQGQYMGLTKVNSYGLNLLRDEFNKSNESNIQMTGLLQRIIKANLAPVQGVPNTNLWGEVDCKSDLTLYQQMKL